MSPCPVLGQPPFADIPQALSHRSMRMKKIKSGWFLVIGAFLCLLFLILFGCSKDTPTQPEPPKIPDCERYSTATVQFENKGSLSVDVIFDGARLCVLSGGEKSQVYTMASGQYTIQFIYTDSIWPATAKATPNFAICETYNYLCN